MLGPANEPHERKQKRIDAMIGRLPAVWDALEGSAGGGGEGGDSAAGSSAFQQAVAAASAALHAAGGVAAAAAAEAGGSAWHRQHALSPLFCPVLAQAGCSVPRGAAFGNDVSLSVQQ